MTRIIALISCLALATLGVVLAPAAGAQSCTTAILQTCNGDCTLDVVSTCHGDCTAALVGDCLSCQIALDTRCGAMVCLVEALVACVPSPVG